MKKGIDYQHVVKNSAKLIDIFGRWPAFHDAEIHALTLKRAVNESSSIANDSPLLDLNVHLFEMTSETDSKGCYILKKHTMATLRFADIDDLQLRDFNCQNVIFSLEIEPICSQEPLAGGNALPTRVKVEIFPAYGLSASFTCKQVEVLSAEMFEPASH